MMTDRLPTLVLTLKIDEASQLFFDAQRKAHFPAHANYVPAHLTLFHKLPLYNIDVEKCLNAAENTECFNLVVNEIILGNTSVAYTLQSEHLQKIHKQMQQSLWVHLINTDRKILSPHITIQNKVTAYKAYKTHQMLLQQFEPFTVKALGITSWQYQKGYWINEQVYLFQG